jgi:hypothetical protein
MPRPAPYDYETETDGGWEEPPLKWLLFAGLSMAVVIVGLLIMMMLNGDGLR